MTSLFKVTLCHAGMTAKRILLASGRSVAMTSRAHSVALSSFYLVPFPESIRTSR